MMNAPSGFEITVDGVPQHGSYATRSEAEAAVVAARATYPKSNVLIREPSNGQHAPESLPKDDKSFVNQQPDVVDNDGSLKSDSIAKDFNNPPKSPSVKPEGPLGHTAHPNQEGTRAAVKK